MNGDAEVVGAPWQSELRYAAFRTDAIQQAIVAVHIRNRVVVAVAEQRAHDWERIAAFTCLCAADNTRDSYGHVDAGNSAVDNRVVG